MYFYRMNSVPKDWWCVSTILVLNITVLRSKVHCCRFFLPDSTLLSLLSSWVHPNYLSNWPVGTPRLRVNRLFLPLRSNPHVLFKKVHASKKNSWSRFIVTKRLYPIHFSYLNLNKFVGLWNAYWHLTKKYKKNHAWKVNRNESEIIVRTTANNWSIKWSQLYQTLARQHLPYLRDQLVLKFN